MVSLKTCRFHIPSNFKVAEVLTIIKKKLQVSRDSQQGLILLADGKFLMKHETGIAEIFEKHRDKEDGFLYVIYAEEQVYGGDC